MKDKKYIIAPGKIISRSDGDEHYIGASQLMDLYKIEPYECIIVDNPDSVRMLNWDDYIVLRPRTDGNYNLPTP